MSTPGWTSEPHRMRPRPEDYWADVAAAFVLGLVCATFWLC